MQNKKAFSIFIVLIIILAIIVVVLCGVLIYRHFLIQKVNSLSQQIQKLQQNQNPITNNQPINNTNNSTIKNMSHIITIKTNMGDISFTTYDADAPNTVKNFTTLADKGFYNGVIFHRVIPGFMIQGGDPLGTGTGGPGYTFADELNPNTDSYKAGYQKGVVAMANAGPNTNGSQFFIMVADYPLPNSYTIFGKVVSGQDVADAISKVPADSNNKPLSKVTMESVTVADYTAK
jgi:cyclophilin family peptidyl-prolyl cis-trans isomerase